MEAAIRLSAVPGQHQARAIGAAGNLFGQHFHLNSALNVWVHAWIWQANPAGIFKDWNPNVGACP
jgi:hypothetical protein